MSGRWHQSPLSFSITQASKEFEKVSQALEEHRRGRELAAQILEAMESIFPVLPLKRLKHRLRGAVSIGEGRSDATFCDELNDLFITIVRGKPAGSGFSGVAAMSG
jgi:hypothetical protein